MSPKLSRKSIYRIFILDYIDTFRNLLFINWGCFKVSQISHIKIQENPPDTFFTHYVKIEIKVHCTWTGERFSL